MVLMSDFVQRSISVFLINRVHTYSAVLIALVICIFV